MANRQKKVFWFIKPVKEMGGLTDGTERGVNIEHRTLNTYQAYAFTNTPLCSRSFLA